MNARYPLHAVVWELTLGCNLRCAFCGSGAGVPRPNELSTDEALALCEEFSTLGVQRVTLMGGEPLLRADILTIAASLTQRGIRTDMVTNGTLLCAELAHQLRDLDVYGVSVSLDGPKDVHDALRCKPGHFASVSAAVERGQEAGLQMGIITHVNRLNYDSLDEVYQVLCDWCVSGWQIQLTSPLGFAAGKDVVLTKDQFVQLHEWVLTKQAHRALRIYVADDIGYFHPQEPALRGSRHKDQFWQGCSAGLTTAGIASDGGVRGCMSLPKRFTEDNIRCRPFAEIWNDPSLFLYNRQPIQLCGNCGKCDFGQICKGGCLSSSFALTGRFRDVDYCWHQLTRMSP